MKKRAMRLKKDDMSLYARLLILLLFLGSCTSNFSTLSNDRTRIELSSIDDLYQFLTYNEARIPLVSAHRGGPGPGFPENAIETFERAARSQPVIIECDVVMTKDSVLILMHDDRLDRTTNGTGLVRDFTYKELQELRLVDDQDSLTSYRIPSLEKALQWGAGKVIFTLDVKRGTPYKQVIDLIRKVGAEPYSIIITYSATQAALVHELAPELMISASIKKAEDLLRLNDLGVPDNRLVAFVGSSEPLPEVYDFLHEHGILCILGTMGNLDNQAKARGDALYFDLIDRGADILSTDRHLEAGNELKKYRQDNNLLSDFIR